VSHAPAFHPPSCNYQKYRSFLLFFYPSLFLLPHHPDIHPQSHQDKSNPIHTSITNPHQQTNKQTHNPQHRNNGRRRILLQLRGPRDHQLLHGHRERHRHRHQGYHQRKIKTLTQHHRASSPSSPSSPTASPAARPAAGERQPAQSKRDHFSPTMRLSLAPSRLPSPPIYFAPTTMTRMSTTATRKCRNKQQQHHLRSLLGR
jgi:hypothetical protein